MDGVDRRIVEMLKRNSRRSYSSISRELGLSEAAVRKRVQSLVERGIIERFTVAQGGGVRAYIMIECRTGANFPRMVGEILSIDGVEEVGEVSGQYDIIARLYAYTTEELNGILDRIRNVEGVEKTYTCIVLKSHYR